MKEAAVVINRNGEPIFWHTPENRTSVKIPNSLELWDVLGDNADDLLGVAHSHPGSGTPTPSWEDVTTFDAIEHHIQRGGVRRLDWWITSQDTVIRLWWRGPEYYNYGFEIIPDPPWVHELRRITYAQPVRLRDEY